MADDERLTAHPPSDLQATGRALAEPYGEQESSGCDFSIDDRMRDMEKGLIIEALKRAGGVQVKAAQLLGISPRSLWHREKNMVSIPDLLRNYKFCSEITHNCNSL
jgi:DNA-binding NtrC family response regulator